MNKIFILLLLIILHYNILPSYGMIAIDKKYLLFDDKTRNHELFVMNTSDTEKTYKVSVVYLLQQADGSYKEQMDESKKLVVEFLKFTQKMSFSKNGFVQKKI